MDTRCITFGSVDIHTYSTKGSFNKRTAGRYRARVWKQQWPAEWEKSDADKAWDKWLAGECHKQAMAWAAELGNTATGVIPVAPSFIVDSGAGVHFTQGLGMEHRDGDSFTLETANGLISSSTSAQLSVPFLGPVTATVFRTRLRCSASAC
jgi:hypothetical protein